MKVYSQIAGELTEQYFQFDPSFGPYILTLREKMEAETHINAKFYRYLIKKFQQHPHLLIPFKNVEILEEHDEIIQLLRMSLMPLSASSDNFLMALAFMQPSSLFYYTPLFKKTFIDEHVEFDTKEDVVNNLRYFVKLVLERCYKINAYDNPKTIKKVYNQEKYTTRYYQLNVESRFIHVHSQGEFPPLDDAWHKMLNSNDDEFLELFSRFPSYKFRLEGFALFSAEDVSKEMALNQLKDAVLNMHTAELEETLESAGAAIGELVNDSRIKIGITPFFKVNGKVVYDSSFTNMNQGIPSEEKRDSKFISMEDIYNKFTANPEPYIASGINNRENNKPSLCGMQYQDIKSFIAYPIITRDGLMGVFELGFVEEEIIPSEIIEILQPAFPLITDLIYYMIEIFDNRIDRLVKEKFTPLQPAVEWKFNEVVWQYLLNQGDSKPNETIGGVSFKDVYPLYGAVDIRDSSNQRNNALRNDFINQLQATLDLLTKTAEKLLLPLLESLQFKCESFIYSISEVLTGEDELKITEFLHHEAVVFFTYLAERYSDFKNDVELYLQKTDINNGAFHQYNNAYEATLQKINKSIVKYLEEETAKLQKVYPFYFERYRTDGVEYNIYIGQSIIPELPFDPIYLKNLKLWQLSAMAFIAHANNEMFADLPLPLHTTQLILVHGQPIDISFRKDEGRFDVEGSYNIRYEILKKRIDKVRVKDTLERLTQPDKIAMVYLNSADVEEYMQHISFLQSKGVLSGIIENLEIENVQGVSGLKALRVEVRN